jgi:hypothetical protein
MVLIPSMFVLTAKVGSRLDPQMEPAEGVSAFTVRLNTSDQSVDMKVRMVAITDWLSAQYGGTAQIGASPALSPSRATFTADLTWTALGALLASEHGAAISGVECDLAAAIPATVQPTPTPYRDEEELRLLQQILREKFYCHGSTVRPTFACLGHCLCT